MTNEYSLDFFCDQLIWGKIICDGKDVSGYSLVAYSPGLTEEECNQIISLGSGGVSTSAILNGQRGYAFFYAFPYAIFSCTERSSVQEGGGRYFMQTRYLVMSWEKFETFGVDFRFFASIAKQIPVLSAKGEIPLCRATYKPKDHSQGEIVKRILLKYETEMVKNILLAADSHHPIAVFDLITEDNELLEFFQALVLLLPPESRRKLTFATLVSASDPGPYKVKVNPTGLLNMPHIVVRPQDSTVGPIALVEALPKNSGWIQERMAEFLGKN